MAFRGSNRAVADGYGENRPPPVKSLKTNGRDVKTIMSRALQEEMIVVLSFSERIQKPLSNGRMVIRLIQAGKTSELRERVSILTTIEIENSEARVTERKKTQQPILNDRQNKSFPKYTTRGERTRSSPNIPTNQHLSSHEETGKLAENIHQTAIYHQ